MHQRPDHSCQMSGRFILNCDSCLTEICVRTGWHIVRRVDWSSLSWTWKESVNRSRIDRRSDVLLKHQDGASWHKSFSTRCRCPDERNTSSGQMMLVCLTSGRKDTSSGRMDVRTGWHIVRTADRELWNSSDFTLNSGIPVCIILTYKWFCPYTEWGQNTNKLPIWPFWDKNHLTDLEIQSRSKTTKSIGHWFHSILIHMEYYVYPEFPSQV
jgi:hypothetical protein